MSDHRNNQQNGSPWMRPLQSQQLIRRQHTRQNPTPVGTYTPNEPDSNEAVYAARAAQARQQAAARQQPFVSPAQPAAETVSPVQQAVEEAAQQARVVRMNSGAPSMGGYVYSSPAPQPPKQPDAVFYQQSTGVQQPAETAVQRPAQPAQPHRMPSHPYGYARMPQQPDASDARQAAPYSASISRLTDAAVLADPMLAEEAAQTAAPRRRSRSRMVMRQGQEAANPSPFTADAQPLSFDEPAPEEFPADDLFRMHPQTPAPQPELPPLPEEPQAFPAPAFDAASPAGDDPDLSGIDFSGVDQWFAGNPAEEDEEDEGEECMDTSRMPIPAPVSTLDIPKVKRGSALLKILLAVMLAAALGGFLWLSGWGEKLYTGGVQLVQQLLHSTESTSSMTVSPEIGAVPATITLTVTTSQSVSQLRILKDDGQEIPCKVSTAISGEELLWICTLKLEEPYEGFLRTELQGKDGQWRIGSEKRFIQVR